MRGVSRITRGRPKSDRTLELEEVATRETDLFNRWLKARTRRVSIARHTRSADLYEDFTDWLQMNPLTEDDIEFIYSATRFGRALVRNKFFSYKINGHRAHRAIELLPDA